MLNKFRKSKRRVIVELPIIHMQEVIMQESVVFYRHVHPIHVFLAGPLLFNFGLRAGAVALHFCVLVRHSFLSFCLPLEDDAILLVSFEDHASSRGLQSQNLRGSFDGKSLPAHMVDNLQSCLVADEAVLQSFLGLAHEFRRKYYTQCEKVLHLYWSKCICSNSRITKFKFSTFLNRPTSKHGEPRFPLFDALFHNFEGATNSRECHNLYCYK